MVSELMRFSDENERYTPVVNPHSAQGDRLGQLPVKPPKCGCNIISINSFVLPVLSCWSAQAVLYFFRCLGYYFDFMALYQGLCTVHSTTVPRLIVSK